MESNEQAMVQQCKFNTYQPSLLRYRANTKGFIWVSLTGEPRQSLTPREGQSDIKRYNYWWLHSMIINI